MSEVAFELAGATVTSAGQRLLDEVDLSLPVGGALVISGANGAGKTTLLRTIRGSVLPSSGSVTTLGHRPPLPASVSSRVTAIVDEPAFWPWMTAGGAMKTVLSLGGKTLEDETPYLEAVGLDSTLPAGRRRKKIKAFSQGMRRRLQVACALAMGGDLLLIDEPTSNLDAEGAAVVWEALAARNRGGATLVVASHDPDAAGFLDCDRVEMRYGQVVGRSPAGITSP